MSSLKWAQAKSKLSASARFKSNQTKNAKSQAWTQLESVKVQFCNGNLGDGEIVVQFLLDWTNTLRIAPQIL